MTDNILSPDEVILYIYQTWKAEFQMKSLKELLKFGVI